LYGLQDKRAAQALNLCAGGTGILQQVVKQGGDLEIQTEAPIRYDFRRSDGDDLLAELSRAVYEAYTEE